MDVGEALPRVLQILASVVAPTTLLTALLFYFGRLHVTGMFRYLQVQFTVLDLSFQDYLIRSADGLFVPLAVAAGLALTGLWTYGFVVRSLPDTRRETAARRAAPLLVLLGLILMAVAVVGVSGPGTFDAFGELPGLCLAAGALTLAFGSRLWRRGRPIAPASVIAEWGAVFVLVSVGLFWAVGNYAIGVGTARGQEIEQNLSRSPDVVLHSDKNLDIDVPGVIATACGDADAPSGYRYQGLKLVLQSGGQYLLPLPSGWTRITGTALVIPRTDALRLEFSAPGTARDAAC